MSAVKEEQNDNNTTDNNNTNNDNVDENKEDPKHRAAVMELISTEQVYVNNLGVMIHQWQDGLAKVPGVDGNAVITVFR